MISQTGFIVFMCCSSKHVFRALVYFSLSIWTFSPFSSFRSLLQRFCLYPWFKLGSLLLFLRTSCASLFFFLCFQFYLFFILLYNIVLVLPYIDMNPPQVYTCSPSWTPLPPLSPSHPSGSSQCSSPEHPVSYIEPGLAICFLYDIIHVSMPFSQINKQV